MSRRRGGAAATLVLAVVALAGADQLGWLDPPGPSSPTIAAPVGPAVDTLNSLIVARPSHAETYTRTAFGQAWSDDVDVEGGHDGCDTRNQMLQRDAVPGSLSIKPGTRNCKVLAGTWISPYTGQQITDRGQASIDHVVPLAEAWRSGASTWTETRRRDYANDPRVLLTVDARSNQSKGADTPDEWMPALNRCRYAEQWITIKAAYSLTIAAAEKRSLATTLTSCGLPAADNGPSS